MVEHHMGMVMEIADEIAVLHNGELIAESTPEAVRKDPRVIEAYLKGKRPMLKIKKLTVHYGPSLRSTKSLWR